MSIFQILHISDLHINTKEHFDRSVVLDPLIERVKTDMRSGFQPEIVVVTGDIAATGIKNEYEMAEKFFKDLRSALGLSVERLFIVPGNHDVDRKRYRPKDIPSYDNMKELNDELENEEYRTDLLKGMEEYFRFVATNYPHLKSRHENLVPFVHNYQATCGKKIGLVGLNSAWMCRKSPDEREIAIGEYQVKMAMEELKAFGGCDLVINIFHHPLSWLWLVDMKICRRYFDGSILLTGHLHDPDGGYVEGLDGKYYLFQAGCAYQNSSYSNRYHYITFNWDKKSIQLDFRKFVPSERKWCVDSEKGDDGKKVFSLFDKKDQAATEMIPERPTMYLNWLQEHCAYMEIDKLREKSEVIQVRLQEIYIPLYAHEPAGNSGNRQGTEEEEVPVYINDLMAGKVVYLQHLKWLIHGPVDIEKLIAQNEYLLVEGHPGSGKTTLLRHLAYNIVQGIVCKGLEDHLPVLIFLKDLKNFFEQKKDIKARAATAEEMMSFYFGDTENGLDCNVVNAFCKTKKALFLLDGLDEVNPEERDIIVNSFADFRIKNEGNKVVFTSRPHGLGGAAINRFGTGRVKILPLNMKQVEDFINKWFQYVYSLSSKIGSKNARKMIDEMKVHPSVHQLTDNPLMLTAICILYHDGKELPGQRAELYKKFIENLLYRRFREYEKIHEFLMSLAFEMHTKKTKGVDRVFVIDVLKKVYKGEEAEKEKEHKKRMENLFDEIEPRCGVLKFEDGQYGFWHLTFQEFLSASYIVNNSTDYHEAILQYWGDNWYKEVIELYIGYLSIENKRWANKIVKNIIEAEDTAPYNRWLLASRSILDIHKDRRENEVLDVTRKRLMEIVETNVSPQIRAEAGETLGWIGDPRNLKEFVRIEGGEYKLSLGIVKIKPFEIGKYPVTNQWYEEFIHADGYENKEYWTNEGKKWLEETKIKEPQYWNDRRGKCPNASVIGVSWYEAYAFTRWLTTQSNDGYEYRLPDEKEWAASASGFEGRVYPWGNDLDKNRCNNNETGIDKTSTVGIFKDGNTPEGVTDLSGNVLEWTDSRYDESKDFRVLRGGSWDYPVYLCHCANRNRNYPDFRDYNFGFRCARTPKRS